MNSVLNQGWPRSGQSEKSKNYMADIVELKIKKEEIEAKRFIGIEYPGFITKEDVNNMEAKHLWLSAEKEAETSSVDDNIKLLFSLDHHSRITASKQKSTMLALKVKKDANGKIISASFEGVVENNFIFRELFDYSVNDWASKQFEADLEKARKDFNIGSMKAVGDSVDEKEKYQLDPSIIAAFKFSPGNIPYSFKDLITYGKISKRKSRKERGATDWVVSFSDKEIPSGPVADYSEKLKNVPVAHIELVQKIFEERPIVSKLYLLCKIKDQEVIANLKTILPAVAYFWQNGPWHSLWTKYGVDPRSDASYRFFQPIEVRTRMFSTELKRGKSSMSFQSKFNEWIKEQTEESAYKFDGQTLRLNYLTYQLVDVSYAPIMEVINYPGNIRKTCDDKDGWYPPGTIKKIRDMMKNRWMEMLKNIDLSTLPADKLEEILEIFTPEMYESSRELPNVQTISKLLNESIAKEEARLQNASIQDEIYEEEEDDSDYEIFD